MTGIPHGEEKSLYDQQPIEAVTMADAALAAFRLDRDDKYLTVILPGQRLVSRQKQFERGTCRACTSGALFRWLATTWRESQPRSRVNACLFVDGGAQLRDANSIGTCCYVYIPHRRRAVSNSTSTVRISNAARIESPRIV